MRAQRLDVVRRCDLLRRVAKREAVGAPGPAYRLLVAPEQAGDLTECVGAPLRPDDPITAESEQATVRVRGDHLVERAALLFEECEQVGTFFRGGISGVVETGLLVRREIHG